jgi:Protein-L-isoaspartate carboxylmethyltransferase
MCSFSLSFWDTWQLSSLYQTLIATNSLPQHAHALELLREHLENGKRALDVGSGSGYLTTCMALMMGEHGKAVGIDHIPDLVNSSVKNVEKSHKALLDSGRVLLVSK